VGVAQHDFRGGLFGGLGAAVDRTGEKLGRWVSRDTVLRKAQRFCRMMIHGFQSSSVG